jgi:hypothetical protein
MIDSSFSIEWAVKSVPTKWRLSIDLFSSVDLQGCTIFSYVARESNSYLAVTSSNVAFQWTTLLPCFPGNPRQAVQTGFPLIY